MKKSDSRYRTSLACVIVALFLASSAEAATVTVTSSADAGGTCPGATCTLRQAIATAGSGDTVVFHIPTTDLGYDAATGVFLIAVKTEFLINKSLTIDGAGSKIDLDGTEAAKTTNLRIIHVTAGTVVLSNLQITRGYLEGLGGPGGAGVFNEAT